MSQPRLRGIRQDQGFIRKGWRWNLNLGSMASRMNILTRRHYFLPKLAKDDIHQKEHHIWTAGSWAPITLSLPPFCFFCSELGLGNTVLLSYWASLFLFLVNTISLSELSINGLRYDSAVKSTPPALLSEDLHSICSIHIVAHNSLELWFQGIRYSLLATMATCV